MPAAATLLVAVSVLAGCTKSSPDQPASPTGAGGSSVVGSSTATATGSTPAPSSTAAPTPTPTATRAASLGGVCDDLLPVSRIDGAVGKAVLGSTSFIVGVPEANIGRLAYLNCRYGLSKRVAGKPTPIPKVELGVSLYKTATQAAARVQATMDDYRSNNAVPTPVTIGQYAGTILVGYGAPTLVIGAGPRTVAVTISTKLLGPAPTAKALINVATLALSATEDFTQGGPVTSASAAATADPTDSVEPSPAAS
jgi:hypothetical protein